MALRQAVSDAKLWEMRFQAAEKSRETYRESGRRLIQENEQLQSAISQVYQHIIYRRCCKCVWVNGVYCYLQKL